MLAESIPGESVTKAQRYLLKNMENRLTEGSRKFLEALGEVDSGSLFFYPLSLQSETLELQTQAVQNHMMAMIASCDKAEIQLNLTNKASEM